MKFIKKHKLTVFILTLLLAGVVAILIFSNTIMFDDNQAIYGNRLEGIKEVEVTDKQKKEVQEKISEQTESVKVRVSGKVVYITIITTTGTDQEAAKSMGEKTLEPFTAEQKSFYDFQILINNKENQEQYPILGYKHRQKDAITWTKDR